MRTEHDLTLSVMYMLVTPHISAWIPEVTDVQSYQKDRFIGNRITFLGRAREGGGRGGGGDYNNDAPWCVSRGMYVARCMFLVCETFVLTCVSSIYLTLSILMYFIFFTAH